MVFIKLWVRYEVNGIWMYDSLVTEIKSFHPCLIALGNQEEPFHNHAE